MDFICTKSKIKSLSFASLAILVSPVVIAGQQSFEARADALGGAGVASVNRIGAAFFNPAMLSATKNKTDDFSLLLPSLNIKAADPDNILDSIDDIQTSYDELNNALKVATPVNPNLDNIDAAKAALIKDLNDIDGDKAYLNAGIGFAAVLSEFKSGVNTAIFYKSYADASVNANISPEDISYINGIPGNIADPNNPVLEDLKSKGVVLGGAISDLGIAFSYPITVADMPLSFGFSPKFQRIDTYQYVVEVNNFDANDATEDQFRTDATAFNLDIGMAFEPVSGLVVALAGRNLIEQELETTDFNDLRFNDLGNLIFTYQVKPQFTAGAAYDFSFLTLTTDLDLNKQIRFKELEDTSHQYFRVGAEIHPVDAFALRVGYRQDLEDNTEDVVTAGIGLSAFGVFDIDISGSYGENNTVGAALQTSFYF